jgi:hypothetical protein
MTYHRTLIDCSRIKPFLEELVERCDSADVAAEYAGISGSSIYRIRHDEHCTVQRRTAQLILAALENKRDEDLVTERNRRKRVTDAILRQSELDDAIERLTGY